MFELLIVIFSPEIYLHPFFFFLAASAVSCRSRALFHSHSVSAPLGMPVSRSNLCHDSMAGIPTPLHPHVPLESRWSKKSDRGYSPIAAIFKIFFLNLYPFLIYWNHIFQYLKWNIKKSWPPMNIWHPNGPCFLHLVACIRVIWSVSDVRFSSK